jgi:hypothetical protein
MMMLLSAHRPAMGKFQLKGGLKAAGWLATLVMAVAAFGMIATAQW